MKKLTALILCALVMLSCAVTVFAAELPAFTITPETVEAAPGDTLDFTVSIETEEKCRTLGLILQYDAAIFELVDGTCKVDDALVSTFARDRGFIFLFAKAKKLDGEICTFTLKVRDAAAAGTYEVGLKTSMKDSGDPLETEIHPAMVTVVREDDAPTQPKPTDPPKETDAPTKPPKATEPPKETEPVKATEPPKETEPVKATEPQKETEPEEVTETTEATEVTTPSETVGVPSTDPQPTETTGEPSVTQNQTPTEAVIPTESDSTSPRREFKFPLWAIPVYAVGFLAIIVILILKRKQK